MLGKKKYNKIKHQNEEIIIQRYTLLHLQNMIRVTGMKNVKMWMKFARSDSISVFMEVRSKQKK